MNWSPVAPRVTFSYSRCTGKAVYIVSRPPMKHQVRLRTQRDTIDAECGAHINSAAQFAEECTHVLSVIH